MDQVPTNEQNVKEDITIDIVEPSNTLLDPKEMKKNRSPPCNVLAARTESQTPSILMCIPTETQAKLSFQNVDFVVGESPKATDAQDNQTSCFSSKPQQRILQNVSGIMKPGLNAIMGPTGSGKSSLLDILAGRKDPAGLSGNVLINSRPLPSNFKRISGYVVQQDIVIGTLTVRENLWFSANLRLPRSVSNKDKKKRIQEILYDLGLTMCADTKIGNEMIRGVSGGEKKRASIGMELITAPTVLFLDEPTTGLDASTANSVMFLLKRLGNKGRTIILSIHQPRYSIFRQFDTLTLLSLGRLIYHGPNEKVLPHFDALGYHCEEHNNPADFFLDVINGDSTALSNDIDQDNPDVLTDELDHEMEETSDETSKSMAEQLSDHFAKSEIFSTTQQELKEIYSNFQGSKKKVAFEGKSAYATPFY
uniref:ABC transporter domain-containing protein n=1 Tax=Ciona savignyi TaxID=51511 RepID=H2YBJ3_CIOSA